MDDAYEWVSTREAALRLGVSSSTVERLVRRGELVAERVERPGGTRLLIRLDRPQEPPQATSDDVAAAEAPATSGAPQATPGGAERALELLAAALTEERAERQRLSVEVRDLAAARAAAETRATMLQAERDALRARLEAAEAGRDRLRARRWWRWWD